MNEIIGLALAAIGQLVQIAAEAAANAKAAESEVLARLKVVLTASLARVDAQLLVLDAARADADAKIRANAPVEPAMINPVLRPPAEGGG